MVSWSAASRERLISGRRADVVQRYRWTGGAWAATSDRYRNVATTTTPTDPEPPGGGNGADIPAVPTGYQLFYQVDFRDIGTALPAGWTAQNRTGGNSAGTYRPQNLAVVRGVGLVHTAERASVGAPIYTAGAYGRINVPQFCHIRFAARIEGAAEGIWPSFWQRPQSGGAMEGEKDNLEVFFGHLYPNQSRGTRIFGAGYILTPYPKKGESKVDMDSQIGGIDSSNRITDMARVEASHVYETRQTPGAGATVWVDSKLVGTIRKSTVSPASAQSLWDAQFENPAATWYLRTDFQISGTGTQAGTTNAGSLSANQVGKFARWIVEWVQISVPA